MGQLHRFFQESLEEGALILGAEEGHHCAKVLRHRVGDAIELFDGRGCRGECVITHLQGSVVTVECKRVEERTSVPHPLVLAQAIPKGKTMDWIVQRAVELGVQQIIPLRTERTASSGASGKVEKWRKVALEACKQCCQDWLPVISEVTAFDDFVRNDEALGRYAGVIHPRAQPLHDQWRSLGNPGDQVSLLIGPEGDLTPEELEVLDAYDVVPLHFGPLILRCETAAVYGLSLLSHQLLSDGWTEDPCVPRNHPR